MMLDSIPNLPVIAAERFVLRPIRKSDEGLLSLYAADERVARMTRNIPHPLPPGAMAAFIRRYLADDRPGDVWVMDGSASGAGEMLGLMLLEPLGRDQSEISYLVAPAFWNTGIATEALQAMLDANPHEAAQICAEVFQDNPGSARVLTNCGFDYLGAAEAHSVARGAMVPTWTYMRKMRA